MENNINNNNNNENSINTLKLPCIFINHGGGPLPILGQQPHVSNTLQLYSNLSLSLLNNQIKYILIITAHWVTDIITISSNIKHSLLFDYYNFPSETYKYQYNAPGSPELTDKIIELLNLSNIEAQKDSVRGWDHGVFIPLMLLYPDANIPVVSMSVQSSLDPEYHIRIGKALAPLREQGVLIIGSGAAFHNFDYFRPKDPNKKIEGIEHSHRFTSYLDDTLTDRTNFSKEERLQRLINWFEAPSARESNKVGEEEHLIPLHVIAGAGFELSDLPAKRFGVAPPDDYFEIPNYEWI